MSHTEERKKVTIQTVVSRKKKGEKIAVLTAYDHYMAGLLDRAGVDILLVGDSAANVLHGYGTTIPMPLEIMLAHTAAVARGNDKALVVGDMPFMSYQPSIETAVRNAGEFLKAGAEAVKIEGGLEMIATVQRVIECGIPVMGHIGLTPQSINRFGGPKVQGRTDVSRQYLMESAKALADVGCFSLVLELTEAEIAREVTNALTDCATIGIGAGPHCDGQVLVINDMLGLRAEGFKPKFLREYANLTPIINEAVSRYIADVRSGRFPSDDESY